MIINCSKWPYTSFLIPAYQKIVIAKKADFHARRTSRSAHDRLANILRTHAVWTSGERNAIMARGRLYNRNFGPRATITLRARSLMFYNRLSWFATPCVIWPPDLITESCAIPRGAALGRVLGGQ